MKTASLYNMGTFVRMCVRERGTHKTLTIDDIRPNLKCVMNLTPVFPQLLNYQKQSFLIIVLFAYIVKFITMTD